MRYLVYSSAHGEERFFEMAALSRTSLELTGYTGDYQLIPNVTRHHLFGRAGVYRVIENLAVYVRVLYVDCDTLFLKDPATTILKDKTYASICMSIENNTIAGCREKSSYHFLNARQRQLYGSWPAINSGVIAFDPKRCRALFEEWMRFDVVDTNRLPDDQAAIIALLLSQRIDWQYIDNDYVWYRSCRPLPRTPVSTIAHWAGFSPGKTGRSYQQDMQEYLQAELQVTDYKV